LPAKDDRCRAALATFVRAQTPGTSVQFALAVAFYGACCLRHGAGTIPVSGYGSGEDVGRRAASVKMDPHRFPHYDRPHASWQR
jgi:hypothetical protein